MMRTTPSLAQQAVLQDTRTHGATWRDPTSPYRAARDELITHPDFKASTLSSLSRKRTQQLKALLHLSFAVLPTPGFDINADLFTDEDDDN